MALDLSAWSGLVLGERFEVESRPSIWTGTLNGEKVAIKRHRRSEASMNWELSLISFLRESGLGVSEPVLTDEGKLHSGRIAVGRWEETRPPESEADWQAVAQELQKLHNLTVGYPQRPDSCAVTELRQQRRSVDIDIDAMPVDVQVQLLEVFEGSGTPEQAVVHGHSVATNVGICPDGRVCLFDWDKSRVDVTWLDLAGLSVSVLNDEDGLRARLQLAAWEVANSWGVEPDVAHEKLGELASLRSDLARVDSSTKGTG